MDVTSSSASDDILYVPMTDTSVSTWSADTYTAAGTSWNTSGGDCITGTSATSFGISPKFSKIKEYSLKGEKPIPRKHKDKNGCVKKSYWEEEPFDIQDIAGITFGGTAGDTYTMQTTDRIL